MCVRVSHSNTQPQHVYRVHFEENGYDIRFKMAAVAGNFHLAATIMLTYLLFAAEPSRSLIYTHNKHNWAVME
jgi:hypothetical protein